MRTHHAPLHPVIFVGPFTKWGIDFMHCKPTSVTGHGYIIIAIDYFTKWVEAIPTYAEDDRTTALSLFNHVIARFGFLQAIVIDHGSHFHNQMMAKLSANMSFRHEKSTPYYPQANGQVKAINKVLKTMLRRIVGDHKSNLNLTLFYAQMAYSTSVKTTTGFTLFQLVYGLEAVLPIECELPSLKLAVELLPNTSTEEEFLCI